MRSTRWSCTNVKEEPFDFLTLGYLIECSIQKTASSAGSRCLSLRICDLLAISSLYLKIKYVSVSEHVCIVFCFFLNVYIMMFTFYLTGLLLFFRMRFHNLCPRSLTFFQFQLLLRSWSSWPDHRRRVFRSQERRSEQLLWDWGSHHVW